MLTLIFIDLQQLDKQLRAFSPTQGPQMTYLLVIDGSICPCRIIFFLDSSTIVFNVLF